MDLTRVLLRHAARVPHVLVVPVPGADEVRMDVESVLAALRWREATGPADTDVLVVAGAPGAELSAVIAGLWRRVPAPRLRIDLGPEPSGAEIARRLDRVPELLADPDAARDEALAAAATDDDANANAGKEHDDGDGPSEGSAGHLHHDRTPAIDNGVDDVPAPPAPDGRPPGAGDRHGGHEDRGATSGPAKHAGRADPSGHGEHTPDGADSGRTPPGEHGDAPHHDGGRDENGDAAHAGRADHTGHGHSQTGHTGPAGRAESASPDHDHRHGHHDHHRMDMPLPGGLAMADVAEDRDGLALDVLHLPLGPVLPEWPAGLVVDVVLQGDVIASAGARFLDGAEGRRGTGAPGGVVRELDAVARVLAIAGWAGPAARARALRDRVRAGAAREEVAGELTALVRRVVRSRVLRLMLRGVGRDQRADVAALLRRRMSRIGAYAAGLPVPVGDEPDVPDVRELGGRLAGAELAAARLLIAVFDPVPGGAAPVVRAAGAGAGR
jgi:hypothetical protein